MWKYMRKLDEAQREKREGEAKLEIPPLREEGNTEDEKYEYLDGIWFLVVAGDGAALGQGTLPRRMRRAGRSTYHGECHALNFERPTEGTDQTAQRAELEAALDCIGRAWCPTVYWTDAKLVVDGIVALEHDDNRPGDKHQDIWAKISIA